MPSKTAAKTDSPESILEDKGQKLQKVLANRVGFAAQDGALD